MSKKQRLSVDFDGVIHKYSKGWLDGSIYDGPVEGAIEALARLSEKFDIVIFTTRVSPGHECTYVTRRGPDDALITFVGANAITAWMTDYGAHFDFLVTSTKVPSIAYVDDRAVRFTNWADIRKLWL